TSPLREMDVEVSSVPDQDFQTVLKRPKINLPGYPYFHRCGQALRWPELKDMIEAIYGCGKD
ncbi:MAG: hypothetical protein ACRD2O_03295, partial [Terriglobia bacterium]